MKRIFSILLTLLLLISSTSIQVFSENGTEVKRYTVLVLDTSGSSRFIGSNGQTIYTADTAVEYVKKAADKFASEILNANGTNYVAVVSYKDTAKKIVDFTTDTNELKNKISSLTASSNSRDISAGLKLANSLISSIEDDEAIKNVVLVTTGMTNAGIYNYTGHYDSSTIGSKWRRTDTDIKLYAYTNYAYEQAEIIKEHANLYTLGIFQTMKNMPEEGKSIAEFFRLATLELASSENHFYDIDDPEKIDFVFGEIVDDITMEDTDGDGLYDDWEINGIDRDNDGTVDLHIEKMGADPNVPDVFVEVDWMVQPSQKILFVETQQELSLAPSSEAMRLVYQAFKDHGINLHIDVGPDSKDFVTGKKWGALSGGNEVSYQENFELGSTLENWNSLIESNFDIENRGMAFKHCVFLNKFNNETTSGLSNDIPGQYFIVANQKWLRNTGDVGVAGTFMHELGHTLGLSHGGHKADGVRNHTKYKPNYLSVMNYLFQTSGLVGTNEVNYSDYVLPDLDESNLVEKDGIDPHGVTKDTGLGSKVLEGSFWGFDKEIVPIASKAVDFNNLWNIDKNNVKVDLTKDGKMEVLTSSNDWEHLVYNGGTVGERMQLIHIAGVDALTDEEKEMLKEPDLEERLNSGLLCNYGSGDVELMGPYTLLDGYDNQEIIVRVKNMSTKEATFNLIIEKNKIIDKFEKTLTVEGSTTEISYVDVKIPIKKRPVSGDYVVKVILKNDGSEKAVKEFNLNVCNPTEEELNALRKLLEDNSDIPDNIKQAYLQTLSEENEPNLFSRIISFFNSLIQEFVQFFLNIIYYIKDIFNKTTFIVKIL